MGKSREQRSKDPDSSGSALLCESCPTEGRTPLLPPCPCITCHDPATALKQSTAEADNPQASFWRHRWRVPGAGSVWTLSGHSRALERTGFCIEEARIFLDAGVGWRVPTSTPLAILVTHGHIDHINALPMLLRCNGDPAVFVPEEHLNGVRELCRMTWAVKRRDGSTGAGQRCDLDLPAAADILPGALGTPVEEMGLRDPVPKMSHLESVRGRLWVPVSPGRSAVLPGKQRLLVRTVECFHTVDDIGFIVCESRKVLKGATAEAQTELDALRAGSDKRASGQAIGAMRKSGAAIEVEEAAPRLAFLCDTTVQVFGRCAACQAGQVCPFDAAENGRACQEPEVALRQQQDLLACPTIIVECTFMAACGMSEEESEAEAIARGHASWSQLRPVVLANPRTTFVLVHFSERYPDTEIRQHFLTGVAAAPRNVVLWLDSGVLDLSTLPLD